MCKEESNSREKNWKIKQENSWKSNNLKKKNVNRKVHEVAKSSGKRPESARSSESDDYKNSEYEFYISSVRNNKNQEKVSSEVE